MSSQTQIHRLGLRFTDSDSDSDFNRFDEHDPLDFYTTFKCVFLNSYFVIEFCLFQYSILRVLKLFYLFSYIQSVVLTLYM